MREFKCYKCKHTWDIPFGEGGRGVDQVCPQCGSKSVYRVSKTGEFGRGLGRGFGRGRRFVDADSPSEPGWFGRGPGRGFGRGQRFVDADSPSEPGWGRGFGRGFGRGPGRWPGRGRRGRA